MNFPNIRNPKRRKELGSHWGKLSAAAWIPSEPDADTLRNRALYDRRGIVLRNGVTYHGNGKITQWHVRHSVSGRTDQFDLVANDRVFKCGGPRKLPKDFRPKEDDVLRKET